MNVLTRHSKFAFQPAASAMGGEPCSMCRDKAVEAVIDIVRGLHEVGGVEVYSDCSDDDVMEVWVGIRQSGFFDAPGKARKAGLEI